MTSQEKQIWSGNWIWLKNAPPQKQTTVQFRHVFDQTVSETTELLISARHIYRFYLNGALVGRGPDRADPRRPFYDTYDITKLLVPGKNVICGLVHHFAFKPGKRDWCLYDGLPGFLAQIERKGQVITKTDSYWRARLAPGWLDTEASATMFRPPRHEFDCAGAQDLNAPLDLDYDDWQWSLAEVFPVSAELTLPVPREIPRLTAVKQIPKQVRIAYGEADVIKAHRHLRGRPEQSAVTEINPAESGVLLTIDFDRPMGGFPTLEIEADGEGILDVYCGEGDTSFLTDRVHLAAGTAAAYQPLDWRGGQRLGLHWHGLTAPARLRNVCFEEMVYPFEKRGDFRCSEEELEKIWRVCRTTAWAGVKDHTVDCLNREQALWLADNIPHNRALLACFGDTRPIAKIVRQAFSNMSEDGVVPVPGPAGKSYLFDGPSLNWFEMTLSLPLILADLHLYDPDAKLLEWSLPRAAILLESFARYEDERGLLNTLKPGLQTIKCFGGWNPMLKEGVACALNSEYIMGLRAAVKLAEAAGDKSLAEKWGVRHARTLTAARKTFWNPDRQLFIDGEVDGKRLDQFSPTANAWAALAGLLQPGEAGAWAEALNTAQDIMPSVTPMDAGLLLEAYFAHGLDLYAKQLLNNYWGAIVRAGHPTLPEYWHTGYKGGLQFRALASSLCHPFGSVPAFLLHAYVIGARPLTSGWLKAAMHPRTLGLRWAAGRVPTPLGDLDVSWEKYDSRWELEVVLPGKMELEVVLPRLSWGAERLTVDGREVWRADGVEDYWRQMERRYEGGVREVKAVLKGVGRYSLVLESV